MKQIVVIGHAGGYVELRISESGGRFIVEERYTSAENGEPSEWEVKYNHATPEECWESIGKEVGWLS